MSEFENEIVIALDDVRDLLSQIRAADWREKLCRIEGALHKAYLEETKSFPLLRFAVASMLFLGMISAVAYAFFEIK